MCVHLIKLLCFFIFVIVRSYVQTKEFYCRIAGFLPPGLFGRGSGYNKMLLLRQLRELFKCNNEGVFICTAVNFLNSRTIVRRACFTFFVNDYFFPPKAACISINTSSGFPALNPVGVFWGRDISL